MRRRICVFLSFTSMACSMAQEAESIVNGMVQWVRSEGGFFSDKIEIRRVDPNDPASYFGVFAKEEINSKELLMRIPNSCYIEVFEDAKETTDSEVALEAHHENLCALGQKLMKEIKLGQESKYAPYIAYLKTQKPGQLPANWSKAGKDLLRKLSVPGSDMVDWIDQSYQGSCISNDLSEVHMMEMTIQRCFDTALVPLWDMVNHDNGRINTEHTSIYDKGGIKVEASGDITAGEEIISTYDLCADCRDISDYWGTPEILRDFGFVENYPTRWVFEEQGIWFEIIVDPEDGHKYVYFGENEDAWTPSRKDIRFIQDEIERLYVVGKELQTYEGTMPKHEFDMAKRYYETAITDLSLLVETVLWDLNIEETSSEL